MILHTQNSKRYNEFRYKHLVQRKAREVEFQDLGHSNPTTKALEEYPHWLLWGRKEYLQWMLLNIIYRENNYVSRF